MRTLENNQAHKQTLQAVKGSSDRSGCGSRCDVPYGSVAYARAEVVSIVRQRYELPLLDREKLIVVCGQIGEVINNMQTGKVGVATLYG